MKDPKFYHSDAKTHNLHAGYALVTMQVHHVGLPPGAIAVFSCLMRYATMKHEVGDPNFMVCFPGVRTIGAETAQEKRSVQRGIRQLEEKSIVRIRPRPGRCNAYDLSKSQEVLDKLVPMCSKHPSCIKAFCNLCKYGTDEE